MRPWIPIVVAVIGASAGCSSRDTTIKASKFASPASSRIFTWAIRAPIRELDPATTTESITTDVLRQVYAGLTKLSPSGEILPDLAKSWTISADNRIYDFQIDTSRHFVSGKAVEASDIVRSFKRTLDPKVGAVLSGDLILGVQGASELDSGRPGTPLGIEAVAPDHLRVTLKNPVRSFLARLSYPGLGIVGPAAPADGPITKFDQMDGAGPFAVTRFVPDEQMDMKARAPLGVDGLRIQIIPDVNVRVSKFVARDVDLTTVATLDAEQWKDKPELHLMPRAALVFLQLNPKTVPVLRDVRVRRALWMAINRKRLIESTTRNVHRMPDGLVPPGPKLSGKPHIPEYNPTIAASLLSQTGYPNGKGFPELTVYYGDNGRENPSVDAIVTDWRTNLGISARGRAMENGALRDLDAKGQVGIYFTGYSGDYNNDDDFLPVMFGSQSSVNHSTFSDPVVDDSFMRAAEAADDAKIASLMSVAHQRIVDAAPIIPVFFTVEPELVNPRWTGITYGPFGHLTLDQIRLTKP